MPQYLRSAAIQRLEACVESLCLGLTASVVPHRYRPRVDHAVRAPAVGLIGTAAELAMTACIVQAQGEQALVLPNGTYKPGGQILDEFRALVRNATVSTSFLATGIDDAAAHRAALVSATQRFRILIKARAGGFHAGKGVPRDVCLAVARDVHGFLTMLGESSRISPYLNGLPSFDYSFPQHELLVETLAANFAEADGLDDKARSLGALFLVFPDLPQEEPDWLAALDRVAVLPREQDIAFLLDVLERARPGTLRRVGQGGGRHGAVVPVVYAPQNPAAVPIAPHFLRTQFNQIPDQWRADIASANGRLGQGVFDPPPAEFVKQLFALGLDTVGVLAPDHPLTAHEAWPFIASSISVPPRATRGPYWFIVRRMEDLPQLVAVLIRAGEVAPPYFRGQLEEALAGIRVLRGEPQPQDVQQFFRPLGQEYAEAERKHAALDRCVDRSAGTEREIGEEYSLLARHIAAEGEPVSRLIMPLLEADISDAAQNYWIRTLCEAATDQSDAAALFAVLRSERVAVAHTAARKALRLLDFVGYGPPLDQ